MLAKIICVYYLVISIISFVMFGVDKKKAIKGEYRIPEATLLLTAALGGCVGSIIAMKFFHHKTRKPKFFILVPVFVILHVILAVFLTKAFV